ncbi:Tat pathway signal sequence domain protein [Clavibacter michiganensis subsp. michiganensis]|uniref:LamG-like jellyroll fold domain-containing protein n=1 Tax=Clavibacter michiganensis TaxID=28447 RepID=UPI001C651EF5|nr:LamG-like jellyroll fold domain-containing protein [Clavibacter michiganensis]MBW8025727.1 Tat pathway signal sequence domain protein [Clavibacter michiganensis subsp. michiganensis]
MTQDPTTPPSSDLSRRGFLITSGAAGALGVAGLGGALPAVAATASDDALDASAVKAPAAQQGSGARWKPDTASPRFTIAVLPDTQYLFDGASIHPEPLEASLRYVLAERDRHNIVFLAHLGDVTQNGAANEIQAASAQFTLLDKAGAAWSVLAGNHDVDGSTDDQRGRTPYLDAFGPKRFRKSPSYSGSSPDGYNSFHTFTAGGRDWLVLALDWRTSGRGVEWARGVLAAHPTLPVILTAHDIVDSKPDGSAVLDDYGQGLWDSFISQHDQIFLTLNGHYWKPGRTTMTNRAGHDVAMHLVNYQDRYYGGAAMIRLYHVDLERNAIDVETLSPFILGGGLGTGNELADGEAALSGDVDRFTVSVDFEQRFAGFAPVPARAARPAAQMLVPGTVAYWRFDGQADGSALGTTTRIRDASGRGNDLVVANRAGAAPGSLRFASAHHDDQPGFGSLALTGGKKSGDYLRTVDGAPLDSATFRQGYTVEAFVRIPADFDGDADGFSAILSRAASAKDAGKTPGDAGDPDEPAATLSVSGSREIQWCVYPTTQQGSLTNWSHELPAAEWWHVAVVNDSQHTTMYVDGCPVVRNPSTTNRGLAVASPATSWLLGANLYAGKLDHVLPASIGDVRIVERALKPSEFMIA